MGAVRIVVLIAAVGLAVGFRRAWLRPSEWNHPNVIHGRIVVGFKRSATAQQIQGINAELGAEVIHAWYPTNYYVLGLPPSVGVLEAWDFYRGLPEVDYSLPDTLIF